MLNRSGILQCKTIISTFPWCHTAPLSSHAVIFQKICWDSWSLWLQCAIIFEDPAGMRNGKYGGGGDTFQIIIVFALSESVRWTLTHSHWVMRWVGGINSAVPWQDSLLRYVVISFRFPFIIFSYPLLTTFSLQETDFKSSNPSNPKGKGQHLKLRYPVLVNMSNIFTTWGWY